MRTPPRSRRSLVLALASVVTLAACVGGMPHRRPGSDLVARRGPSTAPWWSALLACSVLADSSPKKGASGARDCTDAQPAVGTLREPRPATGQKTP